MVGKGIRVPQNTVEAEGTTTVEAALALMSMQGRAQGIP